MPDGPDETDSPPAGSITDYVAQHPSSKTESTASTHPLHHGGESKGEKVEFRYHQAHPGPVFPAEINAQQEGSKEERRAKAQAMNK